MRLSRQRQSASPTKTCRGNSREGLNQAATRAEARFKLDEERGSVSAERRAKIHFGREDPFALFRLAWRSDFRFDEIERLSQQNGLKRKQFSEIGFEEGKRTRGD